MLIADCRLLPPSHPHRIRSGQKCRRDGRVAEGARLESVFRGNSNVGSNPTLSASSQAYFSNALSIKFKINGARGGYTHPSQTTRRMGHPARGRSQVRTHRRRLAAGRNGSRLGRPRASDVNACARLCGDKEDQFAGNLNFG
jgi:hypothetical protein